MKQHISKVTSKCYYNLRRLRQIHNYFSREIYDTVGYVSCHISYGLL